jgi:hypothetical protein
VLARLDLVSIRLGLASIRLGLASIRLEFDGIRLNGSPIAVKREQEHCSNELARTTDGGSLHGTNPARFWVKAHANSWSLSPETPAKLL